MFPLQSPTAVRGYLICIEGHLTVLPVATLKDKIRGIPTSAVGSVILKNVPDCPGIDYLLGADNLLFEIN